MMFCFVYTKIYKRSSLLFDHLKDEIRMFEDISIFAASAVNSSTFITSSLLNVIKEVSNSCAKVISIDGRKAK